MPVEIDGQVHQVYVTKRPHVDEFLRRVGELYECVLFTASLAKVSDGAFFRSALSETKMSFSTRILSPISSIRIMCFIQDSFVNLVHITMVTIRLDTMATHLNFSLQEIISKI